MKVDRKVEIVAQTSWHQSLSYQSAIGHFPDVQCFFNSDTAGQSLRAGGATSLAENGIPPSIIQAIGRWASNTFKIYIRRNPVLIQVFLFGQTTHSASTYIHALDAWLLNRLFLPYYLQTFLSPYRLFPPTTNIFTPPLHTTWTFPCHMDVSPTCIYPCFPTSGLAPLHASGPSEANSLSGGNWPVRGVFLSTEGADGC